MLREIAATLRRPAPIRAALPIAVVAAMLAGSALLAGCGIKGALKLPPPAASTKPDASQEGRKPVAPQTGAPPADTPAPARP
jgi:predicted small lipoprotein YifL